ncbi:MAG: lysophospholipase [Deltaproteobacteria bacterium]
MHPFHVGSLAVWKHSIETPKARLLLVHGLSEHSGRHFHTIDFLVRSGIEVIRFDLRGAGESGGRRQWIEQFQDYVDDTAAVFNWVQRELPPLPLFLFGHSLGGAIALNFASSYHTFLKGLILSAPAYWVGEGVSPWKIKVGQALVKIAPNLRLPKSTGSEGISRDKAAVERYLNDPLCCHFNTLKQGDEILKTLPLMPQFAKKVTTPTLIVHGSADPIIRLEGSFELVKALGSKSKELFIAPHCYHEIHNELEEDRLHYFKHLGMWLEGQIKSKRSV